MKKREREIAEKGKKRREIRLWLLGKEIGGCDLSRTRLSLRENRKEKRERLQCIDEKSELRCGRRRKMGLMFVCAKIQNKEARILLDKQGRFY